MRPWAHVKGKACIGERLVGRIYAGRRMGGIDQGVSLVEQHPFES
ncbi:hypothetical protein ABMK89_05790 [Mycobacteroides abscessus subsp. massiliense]